MPGVNLRPASAESYEETIAVNEPDLSDGHGLMKKYDFSWPLSRIGKNSAGYLLSIDFTGR